MIARKRNAASTGSQVKKFVGKKKFGGKKRTKPNHAVTVMYGVGRSGWADKALVKLSYTKTGLVSPVTTAALATVSFSANGLYDPEVAAGGGQPMSFDQWCGATSSTPYSRYRVTRCDIKVTFTNNNNAATALVYIYPRGLYTTSPVSMEEVIENKMSKSAIMGGYLDGATTILSGTENTVDILNEHQDSTLTAYSTANPATQWYWNIGAQSVDKATGVNVLYIAELTYHVEFSDRSYLARS